MIRLALVLAVVVVIALVIRAFRARKDDPQRRRREKEERIDSLREELLTLCHDERVADSLVEAEMLDNPQLGEAQCYRRAIRKLKYDRAR